VKISLNWLAEYVSWEDEPAQLSEKLTAAGLNVESIEEFAKRFARNRSKHGAPELSKD